jgi:hypothetical protein
VADPKPLPGSKAAIEARQQRIVLARVLAALRLPAGEEGDQQPSARPSAAPVPVASTASGPCRETPLDDAVQRADERRGIPEQPVQVSGEGLDDRRRHRMELGPLRAWGLCD